MSNEKQFNQEVYKEAAKELREKRHGILRGFDEYLGTKIERSPDPLTARFAMDGGAVVSFEEFGTLPEFLQNFFLDNRMAMPSSVAVFQDYREGREARLGYIKQQASHTELRGRRYWEFDGSKANFGPDEGYALLLLDENISQDTAILNDLLNFKPKTEAEWLAKISAFEYIRNDLSAAYYLKKTQQALDNDNCEPEVLYECEKTLEWISDRYFDSILMIDAGSESEDILRRMEAVKRHTMRMSSFVTDEHFISRDLIRSHREVGNPFAMLHAMFAVYGESYLAGDDYLSVSSSFCDTDLVVCPLYGGLDGAMALKYLQKKGPEVVYEITGKQADNMNPDLQILPVLSKIGSRGVVRSSISEGDIKTLASDWEVQPENAEERLVLALSGSQRITTLDDSCATGGSEDKLRKWLGQVAGKDLAFTHVVGYNNIRWAHRQGLSIEHLMERKAIAVTPIDRNIVQPKRRRWSRYWPDSYMMEAMLRSNLTAVDMSEVKEKIQRSHDECVVDAVGFDHGETLVRRTVNQKERRALINKNASQILRSFGVNLTPEGFHKIAYPILDSRRSAGEIEDKEIDLVGTYQEMVATIAVETGVDVDIYLVAMQLVESELEIERATTVANEGVVELLRYLKENNIPFGVYSNTPYSGDFMYELLQIAGLGDYFDRDMVMCSSDKGSLLKPNKTAVTSLAKKLKVQPKRMIFVGNTSNTDVSAAARAGAIPILYLFPGQYPKLEERQDSWRSFLGTNEQN